MSRTSQLSRFSPLHSELRMSIKSLTGQPWVRITCPASYGAPAKRSQPRQALFKTNSSRIQRAYMPSKQPSTIPGTGFIFQSSYRPRIACYHGPLRGLIAQDWIPLTRGLSAKRDFWFLFARPMTDQDVSRSLLLIVF